MTIEVASLGGEHELVGVGTEQLLVLFIGIHILLDGLGHIWVDHGARLGEFVLVKVVCFDLAGHVPEKENGAHCIHLGD